MIHEDVCSKLKQAVSEDNSCVEKHLERCFSNRRFEEAATSTVLRINASKTKYIYRTA